MNDNVQSPPFFNILVRKSTILEDKVSFDQIRDPFLLRDLFYKEVIEKEKE